MAYGYSLEFRTRAVEALNQGLSRKKIAEIFKISTKTLYNWEKLLKQTGGLECKKLPSVRSTRKITPEKLLAYLEKYPDHYLTEIAKAFGVKASSVGAAMKKFGISRKKNDSILRARRKKEAAVFARNRRSRPK